MNWLDTETKAILEREGEPNLAPPIAAEFGLVLLRKGRDEARLVRAICRINHCLEPEGITLSRFPVPVIINPGFTEPEALFGQFELICCDAVAVFVRSEVLLAQGQEDYLGVLYSKVLESPEFKPTRVDVLEVPASEAGAKFVDQFLGGLGPETEWPIDEFTIWVPYKKARLMEHWATRVGAEIRCHSVVDSDESEKNV